MPPLNMTTPDRSGHEESWEIECVFNTIGAAIVLLPKCISTDVFNRYFRGPVWEAIIKCSHMRPDALIRTNSTGGAVISIKQYVGKFLIRICNSLQLEMERGIKATPEGDVFHLEDGEADQLAQDISNIVSFVEDKLHTPVSVDSHTQQLTCSTSNL